MNSAKFLPPRPSRLLERERLLSKLHSWEDKKLIIIHAQAGQGKSTLVAEYVRELSAPVAWYTLDGEDESPDRFFALLAQALHAAWPAALPSIPSLPQHRYGMGRIHQHAGRWLQQLFGALPRGSLVVFDDFAGAAGSVPCQAMKLLLTETPEHVRFLVISRTRPEFEIARLRASGAVGELSGDDLRFTDEETQGLFNLVFHMPISPSEAASINSTAEGWPAGLALLHEHLRSLSPEAKAVALTDRRATGFRAHVFDYLAQEVFERLPASVQQFLVRTSVADCLPVPLMSLLSGLPPAATGRKESVNAMVRDLRTRNLFVSTSGGEAIVIRYHALFREFLRKKLVMLLRPAEAKKLYTIASDYYRKNGDAVRCVDLLIASGQFDAAAKRIEASGEALVANGQTHTIVRWIETLPLEYGSSPWFLLYRATASRYTDPRAALAFSEDAFAGFRRDARSEGRTSGLMLSLCAIIESLFYAGGDFRRMARTDAIAVSLLAGKEKISAEARARLLLARGTAAFFTGKLRQGADALEKALNEFSAQDDAYHQIQSAIYLAPCAIYLGDFGLARRAVQKGLDALREAPDEIGGEAALQMAQAMTALFEGKFSESRQCIERCQALAHEFELEAFDFLSLDIGGWLCIATEDYAGADQLLRSCRAKGEALGNAFFAASAAHLLAVNALHQGKLDQAASEAAFALSAREKSGSRLFSSLSRSVSGAIAFRQGKIPQAEKILTAALAEFRTMGAEQQEATVLLLLALLRFKKYRDSEALELLSRAFGIGERNGFVYYPLVTRAELARLARRALDSGVCVDYCRSLVDGDPASPVLVVRCFNGLNIRRAAVKLADSAWRNSRAKSVFKFLAAQENMTATRDAVIDAFWPDDPPETARTALNSTLTRMRKTLGEKSGGDAAASCVQVKDGIVSLNKNSVWSDIMQFRAHLSAAARLRIRKEAGKALEEYNNAIGLYTGDFLPEDVSAEWTTEVRDSLRTAYMQALESAAEIASETGDRVACRALYEKLFIADACNESACRWLMRWFASEDRRKDAVRIYERCELAMNKDLDLEPGDETKKIYRNIIEA
jgi:LuxR family maltose regulon positive regulatory protein